MDRSLLSGFAGAVENALVASLSAYSKNPGEIRRKTGPAFEKAEYMR
jgi:hypothetical protein